jgi:hypothetical protein
LVSIGSNYPAIYGEIVGSDYPSVGRLGVGIATGRSEEAPWEAVRQWVVGKEEGEERCLKCSPEGITVIVSSMLRIIHTPNNQQSRQREREVQMTTGGIMRKLTH